MATSNNKKLEDYGSFDYADYQESESVTSARDKYNETLSTKPGDFASQYTEAAKQAMEKYMNRDKFSYDLNGDALYQQYKDQYVTQGKLAMQDTIGQAAAMTGGYGNSYAQGVGQQAYQGYLQQLNDKVPELYQLALDQYNREGEDILTQYGLLSDRENTEYGRYRDSVSDWNADRGFYADQLNAEKQFDYSKYSDERNFDYGEFSDNRNLGVQLDRYEVEDSQWQTSFDEGVRQYDETMAFNKEQADIQNQQWQATFDETVKNNNRDYELAVQQIEENVRHNKITEEQAQQQIDNAKAAQAEANRIAAAELKLKQDAAKSSGGLANPLTSEEFDALLDFAYDSYKTGGTDRLKIKLGSLIDSDSITEDCAVEIWKEYGDTSAFLELKKQQSPTIEYGSNKQNGFLSTLIN